MEITAFAPSSRAFSIMRSIACRRLSSSSSEYCRTSPWASARNPALKDLAMPMLRTTRPKATPRFCSTFIPGNWSAVVTGNESVGCVMPGVHASLAAGVNTQRVHFGQDRRERRDALLGPWTAPPEDGVVEAEIRQLTQPDERFAEPLVQVFFEVGHGADGLLDLVVVPA